MSIQSYLGMMQHLPSYPGHSSPPGQASEVGLGVDGALTSRLVQALCGVSRAQEARGG